MHVDLALPDYKIAFFLEAPPSASARSIGGGSGSGGGDGGVARLSSLDSEGAMLSGWVVRQLGGGVPCLAGWWGARTCSQLPLLNNRVTFPLRRPDRPRPTCRLPHRPAGTLPTTPRAQSVPSCACCSSAAGWCCP